MDENKLNPMQKLILATIGIGTILFFIGIMRATKQAQNPVVKQNLTTDTTASSTIDQEALQIGLAVKKAGSMENICLSGLNFSTTTGLMLGNQIIGTCPDLIKVCTPVE